MKVKELIEQLNEFNEDLEVVVQYDAWWHPVIEAKPIMMFKDDLSKDLYESSEECFGIPECIPSLQLIY